MPGQFSHRLAIFGRALAPDMVQPVADLLQHLASQKHEVIIEQSFAAFLQSAGVPISWATYMGPLQPENQVYCLLSIGGDGTLLESVALAAQAGVPILGINAGRLGFLSTVPLGLAKIVLEQLFHGNYTLEHRALISVRSSEIVLFEGFPIGLNEVAVAKQDTSSMIVSHVYVNNEWLNSYWSDGLIISTPTGSTGYNLSCGGPIIMPQSSVFAITPVSPHNLSARPMIVPDDVTIRIKVESRSSNFLLSLDYRSQQLHHDFELVIQKWHQKVALVRFEGQTFVETLKAKLNWAQDLRN